MAAESFLVQTLATLITEFNRRGFQYALAVGWAYSVLVEPLSGYGKPSWV